MTPYEIKQALEKIDNKKAAADQLILEAHDIKQRSILNSAKFATDSEASIKAKLDEEYAKRRYEIEFASRNLDAEKKKYETINRDLEDLIDRESSIRADSMAASKMKELEERERAIMYKEKNITDRIQKLSEEEHAVASKMNGLKDQSRMMNDVVTTMEKELDEFATGLGIVVNHLDKIYRNVPALSPEGLQREYIKKLSDNLQKTYTSLRSNSR